MSGETKGWVEKWFDGFKRMGGEEVRWQNDGIKIGA